MASQDNEGGGTEITIDSTGGYYEVDSRFSSFPLLPSSSGGLGALSSLGVPTSGAAAGGEVDITLGPRKRNKLEVAQIALEDCLACSGCITSAESVLITMQSHLEVLSVVEVNTVSFLVTLSYAIDPIRLSILW